MKKIVEFLTSNPIQYLATLGLDGKPKNRPFMFCREQGGKLWFCTNNQKDVYRQLQGCPYLEISASSPSFSWIRLSGKAVFEDNREVKRSCMENPIVKKFYGSEENPIFEVFYIAEPKAVIADLSGWTEEMELGQDKAPLKEL